VSMLSFGGARSARMIRGAVLNVYKGAPHGLTAIDKDRLNAALLGFAAQKAEVAATVPHVRHEDRRADQEQRPS
jgi:hypothetical protein